MTARSFTPINLRLNLVKCKFIASDIQFLDDIITAEGIKPSFKNMWAITEDPRPQNPVEAKDFLSVYVQPMLFAGLQEYVWATEGTNKKNSVLVWGQLQQVSFEETKRCIAYAPVLVIFDEICPTIVSTGPSNVGLGAILS